MKNFIIGALMLVAGSAAASGLDNSISASYFEGEFENDTNHSYTAFEARKSLFDVEDRGSIYGIAIMEDYSHPILDYEGWIGAGIEYDAINLEVVTDQDHYRLTAQYTNTIDNWIIETGFIYSNLFGEGFKQTNLKSGVGYRLGDVTVMATYNVGNLTMKSVNDWYGGTLRWNY